MSRLAALLTVAVFLIAATPALADPTDGAVTGQVINKSAAGGSTSGATVLLVTFGRKEQKPLGQQSAQTDADGRYAFNGLDRDPNNVYITLARYQNVSYPSDQPFQLQDEQTHQSDIAVYETTTADDAIQLERLNLLVMGADQGMLQFMEMGALVNNSDRTFVTANPQDQALAHAIRFALPNGALGVQMQTGFNNQDVVSGVGGVQVTSPVPPGRHEFALSFQVPYASSSADLSLQVPYPTTTYSVYVPQTGFKLQTSALTSAGPAQLGGDTYALYSASNIPRDTMVAGQLSGLAGANGLGPTQLAFISLGVVLFVLGGGVLLFSSRVRPALRPPSPEEVERERLELVVRLAALDERYATGQVTSTEYAAERRRGKQRLVELTLAQRTPSVAP